MRCSCGSAGSGKGVSGLPGASASELWAAAQAGAVRRVLIGQAVRYFDGATYEGLPLGEVGIHGAVSREQALVVTEEQLEQAYEDELPPWFQDEPTFGSDYTQSFLEATPEGLGYERVKGEEVRADGWWTTPSRTRYDHRGVPIGTLDPFGSETTIGLDEPQLLPVWVTVPGGMTTRAEYDYRLLQPKLLEDPNGNRSEVRYTPLGLVDRLVRRGKVDEDVGDTWEKPGAEFTYDLLAWERDRLPTWVHATRRVWHALSPEGDNDDVVEAREYSDGFGRVVQTRTLAEDVLFGDEHFGGELLRSTNEPVRPNPDLALVVGRERGLTDPVNVVVSGAQVFDNKGRVVEQYEPFFGQGWTLSPSANRSKITTYYDAVGRVARTVNADGAEALVVYGRPLELGNPSVFMPTPWERYAYDANDNAGRTLQVADAKHVPTEHWNTPASETVDVLGRVVRKVERNGDEELVTETSYDIRGNVLAIVDPLGRRAFGYVYDLANQALRRESVDAGTRTVVLDASGKEIERRDAKGAVALRTYDDLLRPVATWARDGTGQPLTQRERLEYGDTALEGKDAKQKNLLARVWRHWDEAGRVEVERHDFTGNIAKRTRAVIADEVLKAVYASPGPGWKIEAWRADWERMGEEVFETRRFPVEFAYDALGRVVAETRATREGDRVIRPEYNRAGALERVVLAGGEGQQVIVEHVAYDAKGQRTLVALGNGVMMRWAYDEKTFRLARMRAERFVRDGWSLTPVSDSVLRDTAYGFDLVGNIVEQRERSPNAGVLPRRNELDRRFDYDALYRLTGATGREFDEVLPTLWDPAPRGQDSTRTRSYQERYIFDKAGSLIELKHVSAAGAWTRYLEPEESSNRLRSLAWGQTETPYAYDASGNLLREGTTRHSEWDHADRMKVFRTQTEGAEASVHAQYLYGADGMRVKKLVRKQSGGFESTTYIDGVLEVLTRPSGSIDELHVAGAGGRVASVVVGTPFTRDPRKEDARQTSFVLADQVNSVTVAMLGSGAWTNVEEYTPWGETSFGGYALKRYRFDGKERDEESGLHYFGFRYFSPGAIKWTAPDPAGAVDGGNLYAFVRLSPIGRRDVDGDAAMKVETIAHPRFEETMRLLLDLGLPPDFGGKAARDTPRTITRLKDFNPPGWSDRSKFGLENDKEACGKLARIAVEETLEVGDKISNHGVSLWRTRVRGEGRIEMNSKAKEVAIEMIVKSIDSGQAVFAGVHLPASPDLDTDSQPVVDHFVAIYGHSLDSGGNVVELLARDNASGSREAVRRLMYKVNEPPEIVFVVSGDDIVKPKVVGGDYSDQEYQLSSIRFSESVPYTGPERAVNAEGAQGVY